MDFEEFKKKMNFYLEELSIMFNEEQYKKFYTYMNLLLEWNEKINLTAITDKEEIILKHFIDSLTILKYVNDNEKMLDVGTGAGFPGIPIKIMNENIEITLLDSLNKRINFLNEVINKLKLKNISAIHSRIEDYGKNNKYREKYDIVTSRAVANLATLSEYMLPMLKIKGKSICMKGSDIKEEVKNSKRAIDILGGEIVNIEELVLPKSDNRRNLIIIEKKKNTPLKYPRKAGIPSKEPL